MKKMYSIRDSKGGVYFPPRFNLSHGEAEREFNHLVNNESKSMMYLYPEDYDLFYLGDFDEVSGKISSLETPQHIIKAVNLKKPDLKMV